MLRAYISRVEHGHTVPSLDTLERFAAALDVPLYQLFCEGESAPPPPNLMPSETIEEFAEPPRSNGADARMVTMLKGLTSRMLESDRQLLLDLASRLATR
jgi:transcriptional regulator with XRE-family HTH domain